MQTRHWCFTINNWTADDDDRLKRLGSEVTYLVYGYETGAQGTPHLQGYCVFPRVKRMSEAKGKISDRAHLEPKRGTPEEAAVYCKKDGVWTEFGECPKSPGNKGQFAKYIEWVMSRNDGKGSVPSDREIAQAFPSLFVRYKRSLRELAQHHCALPVLETGEDLRPWQVELRDALLETPPDDRGILFYVDHEGGKGKTWFQRYMVTNYPDKVQILSCGKRDDIAYAIDPTKSIFLFNIPRKAMEFFNYQVIEQLKDRMVMSNKYDAHMKVITENPHVVVFSNEDPKMDEMTEDRYIIRNDF